MKLATQKATRMMVASLAAASLAFAGAAPAFALTAQGAKDQAITYARAVNNKATTEYWLEISEDGDGGGGGGGLNNMSVDVPVKVNLAVTAEGNFVTPSALKNVIENKSVFPLDVTAMSITPKNSFTNITANGFESNATLNAFKGSISSVKLSDDRSGVASTHQSVAFTKLGTFTTSKAWRMEAKDTNDRYGRDCLFIQIDGALTNVAGKYFTNSINVFDITYTFAAASADAAEIPSSITD